MNDQNFTSSTSQRDIYKLVGSIVSGEFDDELSLLTALIKDTVNNPDFEINGGRIWELNPDKRRYELKFQYGEVREIPEDYYLNIDDQKEIFKKLAKERTFLNKETDQLLKEKGINVYSVTAVGDLIKVGKDIYYKYALGFNAPQILQSFYETLTVISSVATIAIRNIQAKEREEKLNQDLVQAAEIQRNLLPKHYIEFKDYKIFGACIPDKEVGGDYFDYFLPEKENDEDERLSIVVSDAASKGLPAAIQALFVSGAIRMGKRFSTRIAHLISSLNTLIFDTFPYERFVTMVYCELTTSSNRLVLYANAGHCEPIHYRPSEDRIRLLESTGGLLGLVRKQKFGVENTRMLPGDILVLFSDGITEGHNNEGEMFGEDRLQELIRKHYKETPKKIAYHIIDAVQKFTANSPFTDDKTLVVIKRDAE